jgi:hypothetical protein
VCALCMEATRAFSFCGESHKGQTVRALAVSRQIRHYHAEHCLHFVIKQQELTKLCLFSDLCFGLNLSLLSTDGWMGGRAVNTMVSPSRSVPT